MEILVATPKDYATGGVELLHQLVYELNTYNNIDAKIWYVQNAKGHHPAYNKYNNPWTNDEPKDKNTILIFPEIWANNINTNSYKDNICIIYWESVDNYLSKVPNKDNIHFPKSVYHMVQSHYALDFLLNKVKVDKSKVLFVSDYLNDNYLNLNISSHNRIKQVLYNPVKGLNFTNKIINAATGIDFIPIKMMNIEQIIFIMKSSMVYIDFGDHPGKDRMPREAAICGCCIITGLNGAAKFKEDINIHDEYKFERKEESIPFIIDKIHYIFNHFEDCYKDFNYYRDIIKSEYDLFKTGVSILVKKLTNL